MRKLYHILSASSCEELAIKTECALADGFDLTGGIVTAIMEECRSYLWGLFWKRVSKNVFLQAIYKEVEGNKGDPVPERFKPFKEAIRKVQ